MAPRIQCAISVDLDEIPNYAAIHGLDPSRFDANAVYDVALPRIRDWARSRGFPLTLFAVGSDLGRSASAEQLAQAATEGHEIGNHSHNHYYDLTRRTPACIFQEVNDASDAIEDVIGKRPVGFRAPGYVTTDALYSVLSTSGFSYSSSVFPCPIYYAAKAGAICGKRLLGRRSASVVDDPRVLVAPNRPYRVGKRYWGRGAGLLELPIQTTRGLRLPFIGTSVTLAGPKAATLLARQVRSPLINFELHGIDVLDSKDGLAALANYQPDVQIPHKRKLACLDAAIDVFRRRGAAFVTLATAADRVVID